MANDSVVKEAAERVWASMGAEVDAGSPRANRLQNADVTAQSSAACADFQSLMPDYLNGKLSEARSLLLVDHTHECIPCRKALKQARQARTAAAVAAPRLQSRKAAKYNLNPVVRRWGIAAALVIGLGVVAWPLIQRYLPVGSFEATVQAAEGPVYVVADEQTRALTAGAKIGRGDTIRTVRGHRRFADFRDGHDFLGECRHEGFARVSD